MLPFLALVALCLPRTPEGPSQADAQRAKGAVAELEKAWKSEAAAERVRAIQANGDVADAEVVKLVARGLRDKEPEVQHAAIEALRRVGHPDALKELQALARDGQAFRKDPPSQAALLRAVGQYGSASSIKILGEELGPDQDARVLQARILGLGRTRTRESLERLFEGLRISGAQRSEAQLPDYRLALALLTGTDQGNSASDWQNWWNAHRAQFKVEAQAPALAPDLERKWKVYWGELEGETRSRKRSERGRDGPP
jgi:hypothetical protein